ncbi:MAG: 16S rRNA (uracil(1498)-N(3))-methyltransferase [Flaviflexus sp.]|uniref:16S rRNA (uracil(1498)-N(3))-methyltransferase n=1 Tax=Flaviflexus sp. TaxID=1969482 RepID=UPI003F93E07F
MTLPVYLDEGLRGKPHHLGDTLVLEGDEAKHAHVKRTEIGERIDVVDGGGLRVTVRVTQSSPALLSGTVVESVVEAEPVSRLTLVQALAKGGRDESAIESAVEIGVLGIVPWQADRSIVRWSGPKADKGVAKWQQVARAAMKQSRQAFLPKVSSVATTKQLAERVRESTSSGTRIFICHESAETGLAGVDVARGPAWIIVGPEGGISEAELELLVSAGGEPVLLGPSVLRSGTAGAVAATVLQVRSGAWG